MVPIITYTVSHLSESIRYGTELPVSGLLTNPAAAADPTQQQGVQSRLPKLPRSMVLSIGYDFILSVIILRKLARHSRKFILIKSIQPIEG